MNNPATDKTRMSGGRRAVFPPMSVAGTAAIVSALSLFLIQTNAFAQLDYQKLADAIRKAEGNANYGVLTKYKHTSPRQACINTCRNQYKRHLAHHCGKSYLVCLRDRYCPIGASNDPTGLNKHWIKNVSYFYPEVAHVS